MAPRRVPVNPPIPSFIQSASTSDMSVPLPETRKRKHKETSKDQNDGDLTDTWSLHSTTFNKWNPPSTKYKYIVRFSRDALISNPFKLEELANYNGATGVETRILANKNGNNLLPMFKHFAFSTLVPSPKCPKNFPYTLSVKRSNGMKNNNEAGMIICSVMLV